MINKGDSHGWKQSSSYSFCLHLQKFIFLTILSAKIDKGQNVRQWFRIIKGSNTSPVPIFQVMEL